MIPKATAAAFAGGWFHSGDGAVVHADGYVEIRDRFKDVIISGGENISSIEVEGALLRHPSVLEVAVVGMPHEKWGESPHAFVVLRAGMSATAEAELRDFARGALAHFKVPSAFHFVSELPKTATGKIQKFVLRAGRPRHSAAIDGVHADTSLWLRVAAFIVPELRQQRFRTVHLVECFANDRRMHGDGAVFAAIEPVGAGDRMDVAIEHQSDDLAVGIDQGAARVAADDVVVGRDTKGRAHVELILDPHPAVGDFERR